MSFSSPVYTTFLDYRGRGIKPWAQNWASTFDQFVLLPADKQLDYVFRFEGRIHKTAESLFPVFKSQYTICEEYPQILYQFKRLVSSYFRAHMDHYARYSSLKFHADVDLVAEKYAVNISDQQHSRMVDNAELLTSAVQKLQRLENDCSNDGRSLFFRSKVKRDLGPRLVNEMVLIENKILESLRGSDDILSPPCGVRFEEEGCTPYTSDSES